ncbi:MAG: CHAD domain-containing protein [Chthonomonadales bacterium]
MYSIMEYRDETFEEFGGAALRQSLDKLLDWAQILAATPGEEPLHKLRVSSRRCRAAASVFDGIFPEHQMTTVSNEVKDVTDALGAARDLDVMLEWITARTDKSNNLQKVGLASYAALKQRKRDQVQHKVSSAIDQLLKSDLQKRVDTMTGFDRPPPPVVEEHVVEAEESAVEPIVEAT